MSTYSEALDQLVSMAATSIGIPATRDPSMIGSLVAGESGGCVYIQFPTHVGRLLSGANLEVPISLVTRAPSDKKATDWLLEYMDALVDLAGARNVFHGPIDVGSNTYPAVTATAQLTICEE